MTDPDLEGDGSHSPKASEAVNIAGLRTPRAAAVAGMAFAILFVGAIIFLRLAYPFVDIADLSFQPDESTVTFGRIAVALVPFAGIAFLWFIGVIRHLLGTSEDRLFSTVFLGSGYLFIALTFMATAVVGALIAVYAAKLPVEPGTRMVMGTIVSDLLTTYAARMGAVFTLAVTTLSRRTRVIPTWLVVLGYLAGLSMMLAPIGVRYVEMLFPVWVAIYSVHVFIRYGGSHEADFH